MQFFYQMHYVNNTLQVLFALRWQTDDEIQLDVFYSVLHGSRQRRKYVLFVYVLIYHVAQSLSACFRRKSQRSALYAVVYLRLKTVKPQRRQSHLDLALVRLDLYLIDKLFEL